MQAVNRQKLKIYLIFNKNMSLEKRVERCELNLSGSEQGPMAGSCDMVMNLQVPYKAGNEYDYSRRTMFHGDSRKWDIS
jgi:hypothetical protein